MAREKTKTWKRYGTNDWWGVQNKEGFIYPSSITYARKESIRKFMDMWSADYQAANPWRKLHSRGYRAIKVRVIEAPL